MGRLIPDVTLHAVLVSVAGVGVLITGEAGAGKSWHALKLLLAGHKLVSDDVVEIVRKGNSLIGSAPERFKGLLAIRGLGIVDARRLFGEKSIVERSNIELAVELRSGKTHGISSTVDSTLDILGVKIPKISFFAARLNKNLLEPALIGEMRNAIVDNQVFADHDAFLQRQPAPINV